MKEYETLYLLSPDLPPEKTEEFSHKISELVKSHQGQVLTSFNWGKRRLAYRVGKSNQGVYIYLKYLGQGNLVAEVERVLKYDDNVLKFLTVKLDDEVNVDERLTQKREFTLTSLDEPSDRPPA